MIDLEWIASQPKPVAIHCPTYHDVMTVLCDVNEHITDGPLSEKEIINRTNMWWDQFGDKICVRIRLYRDGSCSLGHHMDEFYEYNPNYILVSIDEVKRKFDLGEIDVDESCLLSLFGMEGDA